MFDWKEMSWSVKPNLNFGRHGHVCTFDQSELSTYKIHFKSEKLGRFEQKCLNGVDFLTTFSCEIPGRNIVIVAGGVTEQNDNNKVEILDLSSGK